MYTKLENYFKDAYSEKEYPTLKLQREAWQLTKPLEGLRILDVTPICRNTIYKYLNLLHAGATLCVGNAPSFNNSPSVIAMLREAGVAVITPDDFTYEFDVIMDCSAAFIEHKATKGCVELTRARAELYEEQNKTVFLADGGVIKRIETCLGTGDSYYRAMSKLGYGDFVGKRIVVFGSGKVGQGIIKGALRRGAVVSVVTNPSTMPHDLGERLSAMVDYRDRAAVNKVVEGAYAVVTATGQVSSVEGAMDVDVLLSSGALLANMGVDDEYGASVPADKVLANKEPLNFILDDPTLMKYMDATMALHNYGALYMCQHSEAKGIILPPEDIEREMLSQTAEFGLIGDEINEL